MNPVFSITIIVVILLVGIVFLVYKQLVINNSNNRELDNKKRNNSSFNYLNNKKLESRKLNNRKLDNCKLENKKPDNFKLENIKPNNLKSENRKPDNLQLENKKPDNLKLDEEKLNNKKLDDKISGYNDLIDRVNIKLNNNNNNLDKKPISKNSIYVKSGRKTSGKIIGKEQQTANEFINVKDIRDKYLYTRDNNILMYIRLSPIVIDLLSEREKKNLTKQLTAELSAEQKPFKFLAVSRPVDISQLISDYSQLMSNTSNQKQKELLRNEIFVMSNYALSGDVVERQFYIMIWEPYEEGIEREMAKRCYELTSKFEGCGVSCEILYQQDIVRLCNLVNNPAYSHIEDCSFNSSIPMLTNMNMED